MIKASLILAAACCACALLRKRSAAERHLIWVAAVATAALLPLFSLLIPAWRPEVVSRMAAALPGMTRPAAGGIEKTAGTIIHAVGIEPAGGITWLLVALWVPGFLIALSRLFSGARTLRLLASGSQTLGDPACINVAAQLMRAYGVRRPVRLMQSLGGSLPLTWGVLHPRVLLPAGANEWPEDRKFTVLAHELAHVRRLDWLSQILAEISCAIYWFHPLFWIARNRLLLESERACDDAVLNLGVEGEDYAQHLLDIARSLKQGGPQWSLAMARQVHLEKRLVAVLDRAVKRRAASWRTALGVALPLLSLALPLAAMRVPDAVPAPHGEAALPDSVPARVIQYTTPPLYSDEGRRQGIEGIVTVEARVGIDGRATDLRVVNGLDFGLDENALLAVRDWRFAPARRNGSPVVSTTLVEVEFSLLNAELNDVIANDMATQVGPDVVPPRIVRRVEPRYPPRGPNAPAGSVLLDVVIEENGIPKVVRVLRSLTWPIDDAAITALEGWRFSPASQDGVPVKVRMNVEIPFVPER